MMELIKSLSQGGTLERIGGFIGEPAGNTRRAIEAAVPASVAGLADHASTSEGAGRLLAQIQSGQSPELMGDELGRTLGDPRAAEHMLSGSQGFMDRLFGGRASGMIDLLSEHAGIGHVAASNVLGLAMPAVLGVIGKHVRANKLDARELTRYLGEQRDSVSSLLPPQLSSFFGGQRVERPAGGWRETGERRVEDWRGRVRDRAVSGPPPVRRYLPWAVGGLAVLIGIGYVASRRRPIQQTVAQKLTPPSAPEVKPPETPTAPQAAKPAPTEQPQGANPAPTEQPQGANPAPTEEPQAGTPAPTEQPQARMEPTPEAKTPAEEPRAEEPQPTPQANEAQKVSGNASIAEISQFLDHNSTEAKRFAVQGLTFEVGSSELTEDGKRVADDLAQALSDHPDAKVRIEGFADATGSASLNQRLSADRAASVKSYLGDHGVSADRVTSAGRGSRMPVAPNDSEENRAQNRRIEVVVKP
jgi:outer membrane protein OmpA-like peptidoglycan-associated protein